MPGLNLYLPRASWGPILPLGSPMELYHDVAESSNCRGTLDKIPFTLGQAKKTAAPPRALQPPSPDRGRYSAQVNAGIIETL